MAQDMYGQAGAQPGADGAKANAGADAQAETNKKDDDDVVDADFKEV
jgi:hypothetical protein